MSATNGGADDGYDWGALLLRLKSMRAVKYTGAYLASAWLLVQVAEVVGPRLGLTQRHALVLWIALLVGYFGFMYLAFHTPRTSPGLAVLSLVGVVLGSLVAGMAIGRVWNVPGGLAPPSSAEREGPSGPLHSGLVDPPPSGRDAGPGGTSTDGAKEDETTAAAIDAALALLETRFPPADDVRVALNGNAELLDPAHPVRLTLRRTGQTFLLISRSEGAKSLTERWPTSKGRHQYTLPVPAPCVTLEYRLDVVQDGNAVEVRARLDEAAARRGLAATLLRQGDLEGCR